MASWQSHSGAQFINYCGPYLEAAPAVNAAVHVSNTLTMLNISPCYSHAHWCLWQSGKFNGSRNMSLGLYMEARSGCIWRPDRGCRGHLVVTAVCAPGRGPPGVARGGLWGVGGPRIAVWGRVGGGWVRAGGGGKVVHSGQSGAVVGTWWSLRLARLVG